MRSMTMSTESCSGRRVLVVEDDAAIRKITSHALQNAGYEVLEACTADEAIAYVGDREANLDAIVTDVEMPGVFDGYDLAWRAHTGCPDAALFVISSSVEPDRQELPPRGHFFEKPIDPRTLIAELHNALISQGRQSARRSASRAAV